jgi:endonuclease III related protein
MATVAPTPLAALIRPAAFHSQKAPGLIAIAAHISARYAGSTAAMLAQPTPALRAELLALPRIGRETCDVAMLYGGGHPVFVVDEYTRRLFERVDPNVERRAQNVERSRPSLWRTPYETVRQTIEAELSDLQPSALSPQPSLSIEAELSGLHPSSFILHPFYADFHAQINEVCVRYCLSRPRCDGPPARRVYSRQEGREHYHGRDDGCPLRAVCRYYKQSGTKEE